MYHLTPQKLRKILKLKNWLIKNVTVTHLLKHNSRKQFLKCKTAARADK